MKLSVVTLNHTDFLHLNPVSLHRLQSVKKRENKKRNKNLSSKAQKNCLLKDLGCDTVSCQMSPGALVTVPLGFLWRD